MLGSLTLEQQQARIYDLTETVNCLSGQVAVLTAFVAAMIPLPSPEQIRQFQGHAQRLAPANAQLRERTRDWLPLKV
jgi:hypothetical protein